MKKTIIALSASALIFAGCSTENITPEVQNQQTRNIIVNAGPVATRVNFTDDGTSKVEVKWNDEGEAFSAFIGNAADAQVVQFSQVSAKDENGSVKFSGNIPAETAGETMVYAIYPKQTLETGNPAEVILDLSTQTGKYDPSKTFMYASASLNDLADPSKSLRFKHLTSVVKLTLDFGTEVSGTATDLKLYTNTFIQKGVANLTAEPVAAVESVKDRMVLTENFTLDNGKTEIVFHMFPTNLGDITVRAHVGEKAYVGKLAKSSASLVAGKLYNVEIPVSMAESNVITKADLRLNMQKTTGTFYPFFSALSGSRFTLAQANANPEKMDIVAFYSGNTSTQGNALTCPATSNASTVYTDLKNPETWPLAIRNVTKFKVLTAAEAAAVTNYDTLTSIQIEDIYNNASATEAHVVFKISKAAGANHVVYRTSSGQHGIMVIFGSVVASDGQLRFKCKISE